MSIDKYLPEWFLRRARIFFFKQEIFTGDYYACLAFVDTFKSNQERMGKKIFFIGKHMEKLKFGIAVSPELDEDQKEAALKIHKREYRKNLAKKHTATVVYAPNNFWTRLLGFQKYVK